jgi:hypothetical protein
MQWRSQRRMGEAVPKENKQWELYTWKPPKR